MRNKASPITNRCLFPEFKDIRHGLYKTCKILLKLQTSCHQVFSLEQIFFPSILIASIQFVHLHNTSRNLLEFLNRLFFFKWSIIRSLAAPSYAFSFSIYLTKYFMTYFTKTLLLQNLLLWNKHNYLIQVRTGPRQGDSNTHWITALAQKNCVNVT